jgi:hypothetical protein
VIPLYRVSENRLMNRRLCVWVVSIFTGVALVSTAVAQALPGGATAPGSSGQTAVPAPSSPGTSTGPTIPVSAETAADANTYASAIRSFIQYQLNILTGSDYQAQTGAREAIRKVLTRGSTPSYYAVFTNEWKAACMPLLTKTPPLSIAVRLNIGIITATLTDNGQTMDRSAWKSADDVVNQLLGDEKASVSLWGIKAARPLVMLRMQDGEKGISSSTVVAGIVNAVKKHQKSEISGFVTEDAYNDLAVKEIPSQNDDAVKKLQPPLVDPILDILEVRVAQYKDGKIPSPGAERTIATFLSGLYKQVSPASQKRMVQLLVDLETYSGKRADQYINDRTDLNQLREMLKYVTSALKVIADDKQVDTALSWLSAIPPAATPPDIYHYTQLVPGIMKSALSWVATPPEIPDMAPPPFKSTPAPATPATGGAPVPPTK